MQSGHLHAVSVKVLCEDRPIGTITSAVHSPCLGATLALARVRVQAIDSRCAPMSGSRRRPSCSCPWPREGRMREGELT